MVVRDRDVVVVRPVVVLIKEVHGGIDQGRLRQSGAHIDLMGLRVVVAHHGRCTRRNRVAHRRSTEVLVLLVHREPPAVGLERTVLGIGRPVVSLLIEIGVTRNHPGTRCDDVRLDPAVIRRPSARERSELLCVSSAWVCRDRGGRVVVRPHGTVREEVVLSCATVPDAVVARPVTLTVVLAGANSQGVLGCRR